MAFRKHFRRQIFSNLIGKTLGFVILTAVLCNLKFTESSIKSRCSCEFCLMSLLNFPLATCQFG